MATNPPAPTPADVKSLAAHIGWLILILATLYVCYFSHLGAIGFVGPDEPRYAWIARAMAETGDWVTPRLYGKPWFEKPPLYYWGAALSFKLFGVSEAAARLPSAVSAFLATLALAWLALRLYGQETARWLLLLLPTTVGMIGFSHAAATDMPFSAMLTIAMVAAAVLLRLVPDSNARPMISVRESLPPQSTLSLESFAHSTFFISIVFGLFLGLAVLAKGPAGIILCGGAVFFWALVTKRWRDALRLFHPAAIAAFCFTALPWYILCAHRNPDFFRTFIIEHNFRRFLTPEFQHIQPFWYYIPIVLIALFPWVGWSVSAVSLIFRKKMGMQPDLSTVYLLAWILFPTVFFSISKSKLPGYILPAIPPFVMVTSVSLCRAFRMPKVPVPAGFAVFALTPIVAIGAVGGIVYVEPSRPLLHSFALVSAAIALASAAGCLICFAKAKQTAVLVFGVVCVLMFLEAANVLAIPRLDELLSARKPGTALSQWMDDNQRVCIFELRRSWVYGLDFYSHREVPECIVPPSSSYLAIVSERGLEDLVRVEREHPNSLYVHLVKGPLFGEQMRFVEILKPLPGRTPGGRQPQ